MVEITGKTTGVKPSNKRERIIQISIVAGIFLIWEIVGRIVGPFFLAAPSAILKAASELFVEAGFWQAMKESLITYLIGYIIAAFLAIIIGYLMGWFKSVAMIFNPFLNAFYVVPIAALVPVMIIWFGIGFKARVIAVLLFSVFEMTINIYTGVRNANQNYIEVATSFGANRWQIFRRVVFYDALPYVFAGLRIGSSRAIKGMIIAELLFAVTGLGGVIMAYSNYYRIDMVFVVIITISLLGVILGGLIQKLERVIAPWKE